LDCGVFFPFRARNQRQSLNMNIFEPPPSPREGCSSSSSLTDSVTTALNVHSSSNMVSPRGNLLPIPSSPRSRHRLSIKRNLSGPKLKHAGKV
jgi:hypothetical protein